MDDVIRIFGRLIKIAVGFMAACYAASLLLVVGANAWRIEFSNYTGWDFYGGYSGAQDDTIGFIASMVFAVFATSFIGATALVPAGLAIVLAETRRLTGLVYHILAGGITALAILVGTWIPAPGERGLPADWNLFLAAGFAGGFVYWLIAGRTSGAWRG